MKNYILLLALGFFLLGCKQPSLQEEVTDSGSPVLTRFDRMIIAVE